MPGIFGICSRRASDQLPIIAERMRSTMCHQAWYGHVSYADPSGLMVFGRVALGAIPGDSLVPDRRPAVVLLDGEIYDYSDLRRELEAEGVVFSTADHDELLAHGLQRWGHGFLARLEGYFSAAIWQPQERTLLLANDRFGMKPLYYTEVEDGFVFGSELKAVFQHPGVSRKRSLTGIAQFFTFGHFLGDDTLFERVRVLPGAALVTYAADAGTLSTRSYWRMQPAPLFEDERAALAAIDLAFGRAVRRRTAGSEQVGLSLSGGLDARTILATIPSGSVRVKTVSVGIAGSIDHRAARSLAALAGAEHHCHYLKGDFLSQFPFHLRKLVFLTDGHYLDQAITVPTLPTYRELGIQTLLRGHAGELLHMDKAYAFSIRRDELAFRDAAALEGWLWSHLTSYMIRGIGHDMFRPGLRNEVAALARRSLTDAVAQSEGFVPTEQRLWHLFVQERLRRETAMSMQMFNSVVGIRLPYMDADFIEATMRVVPHLKMGDTIQSFMLRQHRPGFLDVINANTGTRPGAAALRKQLALTRLRVLSKLGVAGYQPYERLGLWLRRRLHPFVSALLLSDRSLDRGLFDPAMVRRIIDDHRTGRRNHTFLLMAMLIFETGQRQFVDDDLATLWLPV